MPSWPAGMPYNPMVFAIGADASNNASVTNPLPIGPMASAVCSNAGSFTASAISLVGSNANRRFLLFQPFCTSQAWLAFGTAAVSGAPGIAVSGTAAGAPPFILQGNFIPTQSITAYCQSFVSFTFLEA